MKQETMVPNLGEYPVGNANETPELAVLKERLWQALIENEKLRAVIANRTAEQGFGIGISAEDVAALRDIRDEISDSISICFSLEKRQRWLRAFDALTRNAFK